VKANKQLGESFAGASSAREMESTAGSAEGAAAAGQPDLALVASALNSGAIHLLRSLAAVDRESGLPRARLSALSVLVFGGSRTLGELAAAEGVAGPTMTRIVDGLIAEHLAERLPHPTDGRAVLIAATAAGETLMRTAQRRRIDALAAAIAGLPPDRRLVLASAGPLLDELAAAVRAAPPADRPVNFE
jgi:DNA-binding MarR family transcriptional regulator